MIIHLAAKRLEEKCSALPCGHAAHYLGIRWLAGQSFQFDVEQFAHAQIAVYHTCLTPQEALVWRSHQPSARCPISSEIRNFRILLLRALDAYATFLKPGKMLTASRSHIICSH